MTTLTSHEQALEDQIKATLEPQLANAKTRQEKTRLTASLLFFGHGIFPSAKTVHKFTRHGSMGDINNDLREFWNDIRERGQSKLQLPMLPDGLVAELAVSLGKLWESALAKANAALDGEREEMAGQVEAANAAVQRANQERQYAEERAEEALAALRGETERREAAERRVEAMGAEIEGLQEALAQWREKADKESQSRQDAEERFSRDLEAERTARQRDSEVFEGEIRFAKMQIDTARTTERELRELIKHERAQREAEIIAYRQRANGAEEALGKARLDLADARARVSVLEEQLAKDTRERVRPAPQAKTQAPRRKSLRRGKQP